MIQGHWHQTCRSSCNYQC